MSQFQRKLKRSKTTSFIDFKKCHKESVESPPGYKLHVDEETLARKVDSKMVQNQSWDLALAPFKQLPMNMFMMYMSGNSIGIFPLMLIGMMTVRPIKTLLSYKQTFNMIKGDLHLIQKFLYLLGNCVAILLAAYKCHIIGILPTHESDWISYHQEHTVKY